MENTTNYNLNKPGANDNYNVEHQNQNMDIIDENLKANADDIATKETPDGAAAKATAAAGAALDAANDYTDQEVGEAKGLIGTLAQLATTVKANIVAAINEIVGRVDDVEDAQATHEADIATEDTLGHIKLSDIPSPEIATEEEAIEGENNTKFMTPLRVAQVIIGASDDPSGSPGPSKLMHGALSNGYFGFVSAGEFITGDALASMIGLSAGTSQFSSEGWFKYAYQEKICFAAKKTFRYGISWNEIDAVGAVFGTKTVNIGDLTFKVRLMTGGNGDPASSAGGEWNQIMYGLHESQEPNWGAYTDADLHTDSDFGDGSYSWCQETDADSSSYRVRRGRSGVSGFDTSTASNTGSLGGWRPVLELL